MRTIIRLDVLLVFFQPIYLSSDSGITNKAMKDKLVRPSVQNYSIMSGIYRQFHLQALDHHCYRIEPTDGSIKLL